MAAKRVRAYCPVCNWWLVRYHAGVVIDEWWCHRCGAYRKAQLREEKPA